MWELQPLATLRASTDFTGIAYFYCIFCLRSSDAGDVAALLVASRWCEFLDHVEHTKSIDQISISWFSLNSDFMDNKVEFHGRQRLPFESQTSCGRPRLWLGMAVTAWS
jgi:hypothetical protein